MTNNIRCICIDDERDDLLLLNEYLKTEPLLNCVGCFDAPSDGLQAIISLQPDLVFFDIEMPGANGMEILRQLRDKIELAVFITSHPEFAVEGFALSAFDYILKPITGNRFAQTILRLKDYWAMKQKAVTHELQQEKNILLISEGHNKIRLPVNEIIYLEAMQNYTKIVTPHRNYLTLVGLNDFLTRLPHNSFLRIHRSYAAARHRIRELRSPGLLICDNMELPIGKTYRVAVENEISI
ncbi:LytR/AlgR family response regulator transcription factor [Niabella hirudinis]|uniref:LytR/AlgR family response regulator transcription factor n=1 Tax=Niabella hirudinis TaxID=1285929 RepID=UPI003EBB909F